MGILWKTQDMTADIYSTNAFFMLAKVVDAVGGTLAPSQS